MTTVIKEKSPVSKIGSRLSNRLFEKHATAGDKVFVSINYFLLLLAGIVTLYPLIYVVSSSLSSSDAVIAGEVFLLPVEFTLEAYKAVFEYQDIWTGYGNTIINAVTGTALNIALTVMIAYPISRPDLFGRRFITFALTFTMMFNAGIIPTYLLMDDLGLVNTRAAVIILGLLNVRNIILARSFYTSSIGQELIEASKIDGANEFHIMTRIIVPLSKAILAVIGLFTFVDYWNEFFNSLIYLNDSSLYPLQLFLRQILVMGNIDTSSAMVDQDTLEKIVGMAELLKFAVIVVATLPIMCIYPFAQKFFVKGVMAGAVKG